MTQVLKDVADLGAELNDEERDAAERLDRARRRLQTGAGPLEAGKHDEPTWQNWSNVPDWVQWGDKK